MEQKVPQRKQKPRAAQSEPARSVREPGYGRLQQSLRDEILSGTYPAGSRIKVSDVAARYGTSINPAREALQALEGEGLVVITPNRGARVRLINEDLVQNIFDIRTLLEPYIVRSFVEYATPEDVAILRGFQEKCHEGAENGDFALFHANNLLFHDYIIDQHFNAEAIKIMKQHNGWLRAISNRNPLTLANMRRSSREHWELLEAVEQGDPDRAVEVIETHMRNSRAVFMGNLRRDRMQKGVADDADSGV
ncbi:GntR family transcriptional regulator [Martelella endophytica]|uniref:GntR family transcriptional regulator n=1 Tax=Martelella endophytica TaxID=1486262 RepID=UPI000B1DD8E5|nr:GntR family transcriptional regulator [Martelella endophytica]